jgi:hypothetical protein
VLNKKIWANFQRIIELFTKKIVKKLFKIWSWDPGSGIRDPEKTHSGSRIQGSKRHRIPDPGYRIRNTVTKFLKLLYPVLENKMEMKMRCCGSRMFIPDPGSGFFAIPDSGSPFPDAKNHKKEEGEK